MATSFRVAPMNEGHGFSRATAPALMRALQAAEKVTLCEGDGLQAVHSSFYIFQTLPGG
jgi:hypothetical protein